MQRRLIKKGAFSYIHIRWGQNQENITVAGKEKTEKLRKDSNIFQLNDIKVMFDSIVNL